MEKIIEIKKFRCRKSNGLFKFWKSYNINIKMVDDKVVEIITKPQMSTEQLEFIKVYANNINMTFKSLNITTNNSSNELIEEIIK